VFLPCSVVLRGTKIAPDIYKKGSRERIVKAKWHPWGEHGTSLLVLTDDTVLRSVTSMQFRSQHYAYSAVLSNSEFDTSHSSTQPLQAIPLHPSVPYPASSFSLHTPSTSSILTTASNKAQTVSKRKSVYTAEDVLSKTAVSFDLGKGEGEWGSLAIWGLMKNGDVWTICPFLPEFA
jgi:nucleoporin NUP82